LRVQFPAPAGPADAGLLGETLLLTQSPGQPAPLPPAGQSVLVITLGRPPKTAHGLTWEQVDRWIEKGVARFDAETRTGFLLRQFQSFLRAAGIEHFAGFPTNQTTGASAAHRLLTDFHATTDNFFERLLPAVHEQVGPRPGTSLAELRRSRPEDLLAGYTYRDYPLTSAGQGSFLRVAVNLADSELQLSCWLEVGTKWHRLLHHALTAETGVPNLPPDTMLRLWSQTEERQISIRHLPMVTPIPEAEWNQFKAGLQFGLPLDFLTGDDLIGRLLAQVEHLTSTLDSLSPGTLH